MTKVRTYGEHASLMHGYGRNDGRGQRVYAVEGSPTQTLVRVEADSAERALATFGRIAEAVDRAIRETVLEIETEDVTKKGAPGWERIP